MIFNDDHLEVTLTRLENGFFNCDKSLQELKNVDLAYGNAYEQDRKLKIIFNKQKQVFEGIGFTKEEWGKDSVYFVTFIYEQPYWRIKLQTIKKIEKENL